MQSIPSQSCLIKTEDIDDTNTAPPQTQSAVAAVNEYLAEIQAYTNTRNQNNKSATMTKRNDRYKFFR